MSIYLTEAAAKQIHKQLQQRGSGIGLKLGVKASGCSGLSYVIDYADELSNQELVFEQYGVKIIIDAEQLSFLKGLELDYRREGINAAFKFNNPNVIGTCGCGESFAVAKSLSTEN